MLRGRNRLRFSDAELFADGVNNLTHSLRRLDVVGGEFSDDTVGWPIYVLFDWEEEGTPCVGVDVNFFAGAETAEFCDGVVAELFSIDANDNLFDFLPGVIASHVESPFKKSLSVSGG